MNSACGASSLPAKAGTDAVTTPLPLRIDPAGLAGASGQLGVSLDDDALSASPATGIYSWNEARSSISRRSENPKRSSSGSFWMRSP